MKSFAGCFDSYFIRLNHVKLTEGILELVDAQEQGRKEVLKLFELACSRLQFTTRQLQHLLEGLGGVLGLKVEWLRPIIMALATKAPLEALDVIERSISGLQIVKDFLAAETNKGRGVPSHVSRKEQKRVRQACKMISEGITSLRVFSSVSMHWAFLVWLKRTV